MKYIKITLIAFTIIFISNIVVTMAYGPDEYPVSETLNVNSTGYTNTTSRKKSNSNNMKIRFSSSTCSDCTYKVKGYIDGIATNSTDLTVSLGSTLSIPNYAGLTGTSYARVKTNKYVLFGATVSSTFDPNCITL